MIVNIPYQGKELQADLTKPLDISIPLADGVEQVNCFYAPHFATEPVIAGDFIGSTAKGGLLNFLNVRLNPHGNGTHTECVGHIAQKPFSINQQLRQFHFLGRLISLYPVRQENGDRVILRSQLEELDWDADVPALILRTLPNESDKLKRNYSGTNPPYIHQEAIEWMVEKGIRHFLLDLPSVDREEDGGKLAAHRAFWQYPDTEKAGRTDCTITELIFVPNTIKDGRYLVNIQIASFEMDASPSKPVLYAV
jgi:kynurenine formamidase